MSLFKSGIIIAFFTFLSRVLGLVRELFIASLFGTNYIADSVNIAFKLPNLFRRVFAEGAMQTVFIPIFNEKLEISKDHAKQYTGEIFSLLMISLIALTIFMQIFMPEMMLIIAPGFNLNPEKFELTVFLCRITMPYIIFISLVSLFGGILNSIGNFVVFAASPVIMNIILIFFTWFLKFYMNAEYSISYSLIIAGIFQVIVAAFYLTKHNFFYWPRKLKYNQDLKNFLSKMLPATLSSGVMQLNLFISQSIASFIPGAVSILSYAERLYQFPLSIIGIAFSTVLLPSLSKLYKSGRIEEAHIVQRNAFKLALLLSIPCSVGMGCLAFPIIHIIYERGAFTLNDTYNTSLTLMAFTIGLPAFILSKILMPVFYANQDTKTPFKITLYSLGFNIFLNIILMKLMGYIGIALGSSIASWLNLWLLISFSKQHKLYKNLETPRFMLGVFFSSLIMGGGILIIMYKLEYLLYNFSLAIKILLLGLTICASILIYFLSIILTKTISFNQLLVLYPKKKKNKN